MENIQDVALAYLLIIIFQNIPFPASSADCPNNCISTKNVTLLYTPVVAERLT